MKDGRGTLRRYNESVCGWLELVLRKAQHVYSFWEYGGGFSV